MRLSPREEEHLLLHAAGALAQKRLARGLRLNYTEAVALLATQAGAFAATTRYLIVILDTEKRYSSSHAPFQQVLELIRDGRSVAELMTIGAQMLGKCVAARDKLKRVL